MFCIWGDRAPGTVGARGRRCWPSAAVDGRHPSRASGPPPDHPRCLDMARFRAEPPWGFTNPAQAFVSLRFVSFVPFRSFRLVLRSCAGPGYFFMFCFRWFYITFSIWEPSRPPIGTFSEGLCKSACKQFSHRSPKNMVSLDAFEDELS